MSLLASRSLAFARVMALLGSAACGAGSSAVMDAAAQEDPPWFDERGPLAFRWEQVPMPAGVSRIDSLAYDRAHERYVAYAHGLYAGPLHALLPLSVSVELPDDDAVAELVEQRGLSPELRGWLGTRLHALHGQVVMTGAAVLYFGGLAVLEGAAARVHYVETQPGALVEGLATPDGRAVFAAAYMGTTLLHLEDGEVREASTSRYVVPAWTAPGQPLYGVGSQIGGDDQKGAYRFEDGDWVLEHALEGATALWGDADGLQVIASEHILQRTPDGYALAFEAGTQLRLLAGSHRERLFAAGDDGSVLHYDGERWQRIAEGLTDAPIDALVLGPRELVIVSAEGLWRGVPRAP